MLLLDFATPAGTHLWLSAQDQTSQELIEEGEGLMRLHPQLKSCWQLMAVDGGRRVPFLWDEATSRLPMGQWIAPDPCISGQHQLDLVIIRKHM